MKEIKNWEAIIEDENGEEDIGILLPGCIIKGELDDNMVKIQTIDVDISNLIVTATDGENYLLSNPSRTYLNTLNKCIEIGKKERDGEER